MKDLFYQADWCLSYDDILIVPKYSEVLPPQVSTKTKISSQIELSIPVLSSAMDKVTEWRLAKRLAQLGGLGVIHKNNSIEEQVEHVLNVKKSKTIRKESSVDENGKLRVGAAIGVNDTDFERLEKLVEAGVDLIVIDTAHGHSKRVGEMVEKVKKKYSKLTVAAGNVATTEACEFLYDHGADLIKIGIGPGSICTTRIVAGIGVPQFQALINCREFCLDKKISFIADGGIKNSGDIAKALGTGASCVMLGSLLAATHESPGELLEQNGKLYKVYRGMGSVGAMNQGSKDRYGQEEIGKSKKLVAEGVEGKVPYKGELEEVIYQLIGGLRASMGYVGAQDLIKFSERVRFVKMTNSSLRESMPHNIL